MRLSLIALHSDAFESSRRHRGHQVLLQRETRATASNQSAGAPGHTGPRKGMAGAREGLKIQRSHGDPGGARTPNPQFRRLMLYPIELRGRRPDLRVAGQSAAGQSNDIDSTLQDPMNRPPDG